MESIKTKEFSKEDILGILLSQRLDHLRVEITTTSLSSVNPKRLPRISLKAHYMRIGRCVYRSDSSHTATSAIVEQEDMLRNILLALLIFQKYTNYVKKCDLGDFRAKRRLSDRLRSMSRKYSKMSVEEVRYCVTYPFAPLSAKCVNGTTRFSSHICQHEYIRRSDRIVSATSLSSGRRTPCR